MKQHILFLIFSVVASYLQAQDPTVFTPGIPSQTYKELSAELKKQKIKAEAVSIETDKFGRIVSVASKQEKLAAILKETALVPRLNQNNELVAFTAKLSIISSSKIEGLAPVNVKSDTISGQLYTVVKLAQLMKAKNTDADVKLFSARQQQKIKEYKADRSFKQWIRAWDLNDAALDGYTKKIAKGEGEFVFEGGEWKINE